MATLQERIREYLGSQADTPAARNIAQQAESGYGEALGQALGAGVTSGVVGGRGTTTPAQREYLNSVINQTRQGPGANVPRFMDTPADREAVMQSLVTGSAQGFPAMPNMAGQGATTPAEREYLNKMLPKSRDMRMIDGNPMMPLGATGATMPPMAAPQPAAPMSPSPQVEGMGGMTPAERDQYFQSFADEGLNLTPGAGLARGLRGIDQAVTNATTAPGNLGENQLRNIAGGQSNVSPYGLGLGQQMYNPMGLLNF